MNPNGHIIHPINPEALTHRFAARLEFGDATMRVANDAIRIVQRMDRDWMTPGRRPAGICGAALILAARMNNFRRTVREVVYIVKVQEATIFKRLDEFKLLESSGLTVEEFRSIDLERSADPPAFNQKKDGKKKRGRKSKHVDFDDDGDDDQPTQISSRAASAVPSTISRATSAAPSVANDHPIALATNQQAQLDSESMPPPPLPIDPNLLENSGQDASTPSCVESSVSTGPIADASAHTLPESSMRTDTTQHPHPADGTPGASLAPPDPAPEPVMQKRRGRKRKDAPEALTSQASATADLLDDETDISGLTDPMNLEVALAVAANDESTQAQERSVPVSRPPIPTTADISEAEFADDPEVGNCLLTDIEREIKTRIWTHENKEWLRAQQAKELQYKLAEENGTLRQIKTRKRRRKRVGDLRPYLDGDTYEEGSPVAETAEKAIEKMMQIRGFSKKLNYSKFNSIYAEKSNSRSPTEDMGGSGSPGSGFIASSGANSPGTNVAFITAPKTSIQQMPGAEDADQEVNQAGEGGEQATSGRQEDTNIVEGQQKGVSEDESDDDDVMDDDDPYDAGGDYSE